MWSIEHSKLTLSRLRGTYYCTVSRPFRILAFKTDSNISNLLSLSKLKMSVIGPFGYTGDFDLLLNDCSDIDFFGESGTYFRHPGNFINYSSPNDSLKKKEKATLCTKEVDDQLIMETTFHDGPPSTRIPKQTVVFQLSGEKLVQTISSPTAHQDLVIKYEPIFWSE